MAQIVINIDDKTYKAFMELISINLGRSNYKGIIGKCLNAIKHGKVLPKGHGRLIDADAFIKTMEDVSKRQKYRELLIDNCLTVDDVFKAVIESLQNEGLANGDSPTIIEADKINKK